MAGLAHRTRRTVAGIVSGRHRGHCQRTERAPGVVDQRGYAGIPGLLDFLAQAGDVAACHPGVDGCRVGDSLVPEGDGPIGVACPDMGDTQPGEELDPVPRELVVEAVKVVEGRLEMGYRLVRVAAGQQGLTSGERDVLAAGPVHVGRVLVRMNSVDQRVGECGRGH